MGKKRFLATLLALVMVVGLLPTAAFAARIDQAELPLEAPAEALDAARPAQSGEEETGTDAASPNGSVKGAAYSDDADSYEIYPVPHSVAYVGTAGARTSFTMTTDVNLVVGTGVDEYTVKFVKDILKRFGRTDANITTGAQDDTKTNIILSIHGDSDAVTPAAVTDLFGDTPTAKGKFDPYLLKAEAGTSGRGVITIIGKDTDCVYYGVATLQMMFTSFNGEKFYPVQIEDYSNVALRGFIEGFYGGFDYEGRESQVRSIRDVKGNMYVFASKTDPYHGGDQNDPNKWKELYPAEELAQIQHLVEVCKEMKVEYTWSIHMGKVGLLNGVSAKTDALYTERLNNVKAKFQQLYGIGVRSFHILNDDYNTGTNALRVEFLNDINAWLHAKGDCMPLVYCCQNYCKTWAAESVVRAELESLRALDNDIYLYWTGDKVNFPMTQSSITWPYEIAQHQIVTWLNYPCSEHDKAGVYLGNLKHYVDTSDGLEHQYGFMSNPIGMPEANKVAYFQLLSWCWNRDAYTGYMDEIWKDTFKYLQPEVWESYYTIAQNTSNCPDSGRYPDGFPESEHLTAKLAAVQTAALAGERLQNNADAQALLAEFEKIAAAVANFRANCENTALKAELEPHLKSLESVAVAGKQAILAADALAAQNVNGAWDAFSEGAVALSKWDTNKPFITVNGYQDHQAKAGSKRLQPFASAVLDYVKRNMAGVFNPGGLTGTAAPMVKMGGQVKANDANAQKFLDGDSASYASYTVNQVAGDYFGVDLGAVKLVSGVNVLQGQNDSHHDYFHKAVLEYSADGTNWSALVSKINARHIQVDGLNIAARYVRLRLLEKGYTGPNGQYNTGADYWTHIREFTVSTQEAGMVYTDANAADGVTAAANGGVYTLTVPSLSLGAGKYVGIRLPSITGIRSLSLQGTLPSGVKLQHSVSGVVWTDTVPTQTIRMGYVRLYNSGSAAAALANVTLTASEAVRTQLSVAAGNPTGNWDWANVADGDRNTYTYVKNRQGNGQYVILDLGAVQPVRDVTLVVPQGDTSYLENTLDIPHNLDFFVGNSAEVNGTWNKIGELRSKNAAGQDTPPADNSDISDPSYTVDPGYRVFTVNGNGASGRYLKVAFADVTSYRYYCVNEIEVNKTVSQEERLTEVSSTSGTAANAADGNLLTFLTPTEGQAGSWEKLLQSPTAFDSVTVLRGADGATAKVQVQKGETSWTNVGTLTGSATTVSLASQGEITGVRVVWTSDDVPAIAEVILAGETVPTGDTPALYPNIYEQPASPAAVSVANGTAVDNLPLPDHVSVTTSAGTTTELPVTWSCGSYNPTTAGTYTFVGQFDLTGKLITNPGGFTFNANVTVQAAESGGSGTPENLALNRTVYVSGLEVDPSENATTPSKAVDGDSSTRWSSNYMKGNGATNGSNPAWIVVDLGVNVESVTSLAMEYFNKVWPASYVVQVAGSDYTPKDFSSSIGTVAPTHEAFSGQHAKDASCWTTIKTATDQTLDDNPTNTVTQAELAAVQLPGSIRYVRLYFTKMNGSAGGNAIGLEELTVTGTRSTAVALNITAVATVNAVGVVGDAWESLNVPTHVIATLADNTKIRLPVTWSHGDYSASTEGEQTFTGTLTLPSNVTNTGNVQPTLAVNLTQPPAVTGYSVAPNRVTARHRTPYSQLASSLPTQAVVQFSNGATRALPITWAESSYNAETLGDQDVTGTVTLPWSKRAYSVSVLVHLTPIPATTIAVSPKTLALYVNEDHANHTGTLTATVGGAEASDKTVIWSSSNIRVAVVSDEGVVTAMGPGTATITAVTHDGSRLSDTCDVTVKAALGGSVIITKPTADADYYFGALLRANLNQMTPQGAKDSALYQWKRAGADIAGATGETYTPVKEDIGKALSVTVTAAGGLYEGSVTAAAVTVQKAPGPAMQATPTHRNASKEGASDGAITGLFKGRVYEYQKMALGTDTPDEAAWVKADFSSQSEATPPTSGQTHGTAEITGLAPGNYVVRRAATDTHTAGPISRTVTIAIEGQQAFAVNNPHDFQGGVVQVGRGQIPAGDTVTLTVTPADGYRLVDGSLKAIETVSGATHTAVLKAGTANTYTFTMPAADVSITAQFEKRTFTIEHRLTHISCDMSGSHEHTVVFDARPVITLTPEAGYQLPETVKVYTRATADTASPVEFSGYTFRLKDDGSGKGILTFTRNILEDLVVSGTGVTREYIVDDRLEDLTCDLGGQANHKVAHGAALTITISPKAGYALPAEKDDIRITMGGQAFTDFTYTVVNASSARIAIAAGKITGDLVVAASAPIPLTAVSIRGAARVGDRLSADVRPSNATVSCRWFITDANGDAQTVPGATLVIPADAEGKTIRLEVTGTGRYSGVLTSEAIGPVTPSVADKTALRAAYDSGMSVVNYDFTAASWAAFRKALADAEAVLDNGDATQAQIDDALAVLTAARTALTQKPSEPSGPSTPSGPSGGGSSGGSGGGGGGSAGVSGGQTATRPDGAAVTTVPKHDGSVITTVTRPDGVKTETVTAKDGGVTVTTTDASGQVVSKVELPAQAPKAETRFADVPVGHWADEAIHSAAARKLVNGVGDNKYDMTSPMTRGALATVLHRLSQGRTDYAVTFKDVARGQYYAEGVAWAAKVNVVKGMSEDVFAPDAIITREQLAVMLARYAQLLGMDTTAHTDRLWPFFDGENTSSWAVDGVAWCVEKDILRGKGGEKLDPTATVSRAEVAVMLERFIGLIQ